MLIPIILLALLVVTILIIIILCVYGDMLKTTIRHLKSTNDFLYEFNVPAYSPIHEDSLLELEKNSLTKSYFHNMYEHNSSIFSKKNYEIFVREAKTDDDNEFTCIEYGICANSVELIVFLESDGCFYSPIACERRQNNVNYCECLIKHLSISRGKNTNITINNSLGDNWLKYEPQEDF